MSTEIVRLKNRVSDSDHVAGPETAAVTLLEYGNFECIDCGRAYPNIKRLRNYLGTNLRFVYRHFPTVRTHPHSLRAAEAAEAAAAQGKFWEMHDELFSHQTALEDRDLMRYAKRVRLDVGRFERDLSENVFRAAIEASYQQSLFDEHITGTPTIYLNEIRYTGATDFESLRNAAIESSEGRIQLSGQERLLRRALDKLRRGARR